MEKSNLDKAEKKLLDQFSCAIIRYTVEYPPQVIYMNRYCKELLEISDDDGTARRV